MIQYSVGPLVYNSVKADLVATTGALFAWVKIQFAAAGWTLLNSPFGAPAYIAVTQPTPGANGSAPGLKYGIHAEEGTASVDFRAAKYPDSNSTASTHFSKAVFQLIPNRSYTFIGSPLQFFIIPEDYRQISDGSTPPQDASVMGGVTFYPSFERNPLAGNPAGAMFWLAGSRRSLTDPVRYPTFHDSFVLGSLSRSSTPVAGGPVFTASAGKEALDFHNTATHRYSAAPAIMLPADFEGALAWAPLSSPQTAIIVEPRIISGYYPTPDVSASVPRQNVIYHGQLWDAFLLSGKYPAGFKVRADGRDFVCVQHNADNVNWNLFVRIS